MSNHYQSGIFGMLAAVLGSPPASALQLRGINYPPPRGWLVQNEP